MKLKDSFEYPEKLLEGYHNIKLGNFCKWGCFKKYGGCPSQVEREVVDIPEILKNIRTILKSNPEAKINLDAPNFFETALEKEIPGEDENQHIKLLRAVKQAGIKTYFRVQATVRSLAEKDSEFFEFLADSNIGEIWLGVESADEGLRRKYDKPYFTNEELERVTRLLKKNKISACWYLVVGSEDTDETIQETVDLVKKLRPDRTFVFQAVHYICGTGLVDLDRFMECGEKMKRHQKILLNLAKEIKGG